LALEHSFINFYVVGNSLHGTVTEILQLRIF